MNQRPDFREGDTVMVCRHLFEQATRGIFIQWEKVKASERETPHKFTRDDGTEGLADFSVQCLDCPTDRREIQFVEETWRGGMLHVADFCWAHPTHAARSTGRRSSSGHKTALRSPRRYGR